MIVPSMGHFLSIMAAEDSSSIHLCIAPMKDTTSRQQRDDLVIVFI